MIRLTTILPPRQPDSWGLGHYGAPRGNRKHRGIDFAAFPGSTLLTPLTGTVTKLGYAYSDDPQWRYVEVTNGLGERHRFFYVEPAVGMGQEVYVGKALGTVQDVTERYEDITPHVHYEIINADGEYINPEEFWNGGAA